MFAVKAQSDYLNLRLEDSNATQVCLLCLLTQWYAVMTVLISMTWPCVNSWRIGQSLLGVLYTLSLPSVFPFFRRS